MIFQLKQCSRYVGDGCGLWSNGKRLKEFHQLINDIHSSSPSSYNRVTIHRRATSIKYIFTVQSHVNCKTSS